MKPDLNLKMYRIQKDEITIEIAKQTHGDTFLSIGKDEKGIVLAHLVNWEDATKLYNILNYVISGQGKEKVDEIFEEW